MKKFYLSILFVGFTVILAGQCPTIDISRENWTIHSFDNQEANGEGPNNGKAIHAIDANNNTFWHTRWQNFTASFPHFIAIDMAEMHDISGISFTTRFDSPTNKAKEYELYLSSDGEDWGIIQSSGDFVYDNPDGSGELTSISFGAVAARYFKIVFNSAYGDGNHTVISEIYATALDGSEGCTATGQNNQILNFDVIPKQYTNNDPILLNASTNTELPVTYAVNSGPATLNGNMLSLTGDGGLVTVTATQAGTNEYYPVSVSRTFEVVDLSTLSPEIYTSLLETEPIRMPELMPYRLYATGTTAESDVLSIANIIFQVDGEIIESDGNWGNFSAWWTPSSYGEHEIAITAISSNGASTEIQRTVTVENAIETTTVVTLENAVIDFGTIGSQWYYGTYDLPQSVGAYSEITANFAVSCPNVPGGCDDWDRLAYIQIKDKTGKWIELFRYITPYGVPCSHSIDVTDYESLLQGEVEFRVYIETWGSGGWKMNLNLKYQAGTPEYTYTTVQQAWQGTYNFGDPADLQPVPQIDVNPPANTEAATFRLVTTGHGWGQNNTGNAAEFYFATHRLKVNGENTFTQNMEVNCNPNPDGCTGQQGTWQYNRAGWCPGTIPAPYFYDLSPYVNSPFTFNYQFQTSYKDYCHPNNPECESGITCPDCNDGYNPHYRVGGYIIYKSNSVLGPVSVKNVQIMEDNKLTLSPNPTTGNFELTLEREMKDIVVQVFDVRGASLKTYFFKNSESLNNHRFALNELSTGVYFMKVYNDYSQYSTKLVIQ